MVEFSTILSFIQASGIIVGVAYYIMNIRLSQRNQEISIKNQELMLTAQEQSVKAQQLSLETRQAQLFMSSMFERISSPDFRKADKILEQHNPKTAEELFEVWTDPEVFAAWGTVWWVYEGLGVLVHEGLVDIRLVARYIGGHYRAAWEKWGPCYIDMRNKPGYNPRTGIESEYLYDRLMEFGKANPDYAVS